MESTTLEASLSKVHIDKYSDDVNDVVINNSLNTINSSVETLDTSIGSSNTKLDAVNTNINTLDSNNNSNFITVNSKLDMNNNKWDTINTSIQASSDLLKTNRNAGKCYSVGYDSIGASNRQQMDYSIYNPIGSGKTLYIYQIFFSIVTGGIEVSNVTISSLSSYSNPDILFTPHNVKFSSNSTSSMECFRDATLFGLTRFEFFSFLTNSGPFVLDFQEDIIEISEGCGLNLNFNSGVGIDAGINFRYYEE